MKQILLALIAVAIVLVFFVTKRDKTEKSDSVQELRKELSTNNKAPEAKAPQKESTTENNNNSSNNKPMELEITTTKEGTGDRVVKSGDTIDVHYTGTLLDGTKFDSSVDRGQPFTFQIGQGMVIAGWEQGLLGMKVGEKRTLRIPSDMAYGSRGAGNLIPPNSPLVFDVELVSIK